MGISGVSNNSYVNNYYQNKANKVERETAPEDVQQEQTTKKAESEATTPSVTKPLYRNAIMINGLAVNVDPTGEIANKAFWAEKSRQINESICKVQSYYAEAHKETMSFENPYNHLLAKYNSNMYKLFKSPYFRSDMTEAERKMAFDQELAMLEGRGVANLSDPYAWASSGGVPDREKQLEDAVQSALDKKREEMLQEVGGESTYEEYFQKTVDNFMSHYTTMQPADKMDEMNLQA